MPVEILEEAAEELHVKRDFFDAEGAEIIVRHEFEVRFHFLRKIGAEFLRDALLQLLALDLHLRMERPLVG